MHKPKFVKPLLIGVACTIPLGLVIGLSVNWDRTQFISAVGSSGVKPFIESFGKDYHLSHKKYDVTVESGGTTFAVEEIAQGYTTIGNASNNPYIVVNTQGYRDKWQNKKTYTLGWEGLVMMYSLPKGLTDQTKDIFNIVITEDNILPLYGIFSGFHQLKEAQWDPLMDSLWWYAPQNVKDAITNENDIKLLKETQILPFVRAGGNTGANSSIAFSYYSSLAEFEDMTQDQQNAFRYGQYGHDGLTIMQTDESNARAWQSFVYRNQGGSMTYLTTSFIANENNRKQIQDRGYKIAGYLPKQISGKPVPQPIFISGTREDLGKIATLNGYNWYRPINVMIDLNVQKAKDFIYWIYTGKDADQPYVLEGNLGKNFIDTVYKRGAKPLSGQFFSTMFNPDESMIGSLKRVMFEKCSDLELEEIRKTEHIGYDYSIVYGAEDPWWRD